MIQTFENIATVLFIVLVLLLLLGVVMLVGMLVVDLFHELFVRRGR